MNRQAVKRKHFSISDPRYLDTEGNKENVNSHMSKFQGYFTEKSLKIMKFTASDLSPITTSEKYVINPNKYKVSVEFDFKGKYAKFNPRNENGINDNQAIVGGDFNYANSWTDVSKIKFDTRIFGSKIF